ncbi:MAG: N-acetyltransferase family protein [Bacillota bacterium]
MGKIDFQPAAEDQVPVLLSIYNYYILNSTATFHKHPLSRAEMKALLFSDDPRYPSFIIYDGENICGYCLLKRFHEREAYNGTGEVTIYLNPGCQRKGIGGLAVDYLEEVARKNQFHTLIACICAENEGSIRLFASKGYEKCGHFKEVGRKFGRLLDVVYYQKILEFPYGN